MQKRYIVWWLLFFQIICFSFIMESVNIAIVSMANISDGNAKISTSNTTPAICPNSTIFLRDYIVETQPSSLRKKQTGFAWSKTEQNTVLSGFFWLAYVSPFLGGILTQKFGPKRVIGVTLFASSILSSIIPTIGHYGAIFVTCIRAIQGFLALMAYPSSYSAVIGNWSPPQERGRFELAAFVGFSIGFSAADLGFGYICEYTNWEYVFYLTCTTGILVNLPWFFFVYDSPDLHPTISSKEKKYIRDRLGESRAVDKVIIPWKNILTNGRVILWAVTNMSSVWLYLMPVTYLPVYFKTIYGFKANEIGILASIWKLIASLMGIVVGCLTDMAIKKKFASITTTRKLCTFIGCILASIPFLVVAYFPCSFTIVVVSITIYSILQVYSAFGPTLFVVDMSPEYCGVLVGIANFLGNAQVFILSLLINYFTGIWGTETLWKNIFQYTALYVIASNVALILYGTSEVQNFHSSKTDKQVQQKNADTVELQKLM